MQVKSEKTYLNSLSSAPAGLSQTDSLKEVKNDSTSTQSGVVEMMNYLKENYKHINFSFVSFDNNSQVGQYGSTKIKFPTIAGSVSSIITEAEVKDLKTACMTMIEVLKEEINKSLKEI